MDRFHAPHTYQAIAYNHLNNNWFTWDADHPSLNETLIAGCASYQAFNRYLSDTDLFVIPTTRIELEAILRRYSYDAIHNAVSKARSPLQRGGYGRVCHLAEKSIKDALDQGDNVEYLLSLHQSQIAHEFESSPLHSIETK